MNAQQFGCLGAIGVTGVENPLNVAALGNQVPQLHLHPLVRYASDAAWPAPIWGKSAPQAYSLAAIEEIRTLLSTAALDGYVATLDA